MPCRLLVAVLPLLLLACLDGGSACGPARPRVLVTSVSRERIDAFASSPSGGARPDWVFATSGHPLDLAHDPVRDTLYVLRETGVLALAGVASGAPTSGRAFTVHGTALALDAEHDVLYVGAGSGGSPARVFVFEDVSSLSGDATPTRTFSLPASGVTDLAVDGGRGRLYVTTEVDDVEPGDALFALPLDATPGDEALVLAGTYPRGMGLSVVALDAARDRLYVNLPVESLGPSVVALDGASAATGPVSHEELSVLPLVAGVGVGVDHDPYTDTLYVLAGDHVASVAGASTAGPGSPVLVWAALPGDSDMEVVGATHAAFAP